MIDAARETFIEHGYAATTIKTIAQRSGLSQESLYKTFGGKAGLLKAAYDTALAGDDQPVPMAISCLGTVQTGIAITGAGYPPAGSIEIEHPLAFYSPYLMHLDFSGGYRP